jgi:hypothetical protein
MKYGIIQLSVAHFFSRFKIPAAALTVNTGTAGLKPLLG